MIQEELRNIVRKAKHVKVRSYPYLKNLALEAGLLPGQTEYVKFIILGRSRVGSNFLRGLLNSHSQVRVFGELFQNRDTIGWAMPGYGESPRLRSLFHNDPVRFLETKLFHKFPPEVKAVGFKIFYYHARDEQWVPVWDYLQRLPELKVIHLKRRNILKTHLSRQRALRSDAWVNTGGNGTKSDPIVLSYEACLDEIIQTRRWEEEADAFFGGHDKLEVLYEDLAADYEGHMARVQDFLGLAPAGLKPETFKQRREPLSAAIANYAELKAQFAGTPWASFFEE